MNKYLTTVRVGSSTIRTVVFADSSIHAKLLLQYQFGMNCIVVSPKLTHEVPERYEMLDSIIKPVGTTTRVQSPQPPKLAKIVSSKPKTPDQMRIAQLQTNVDRHKDTLRRERDNQKRQRDADRRMRQIGMT